MEVNVVCGKVKDGIICFLYVCHHLGFLLAQCRCTRAAGVEDVSEAVRGFINVPLPRTLLPADSHLSSSLSRLFEGKPRWQWRRRRRCCCCCSSSGMLNCAVTETCVRWGSDWCDTGKGKTITAKVWADPVYSLEQNKLWWTALTALPTIFRYNVVFTVLVSHRSHRYWGIHYIQYIYTICIYHLLSWAHMLWIIGAFMCAFLK